MQNYHRHSVVSNIILTDSVVFNEDYCKRAKELGHGIISSCEHGTQGNIFECYELAKKYGLKWRYVAEAYFVQDRNPELADNANCHIILAAKTDKGRGDLNEVLSEANISGYYHRPRVDMELLMRLDPRDVFVTTACLGGIWKYGYTENRETGEWSYDFTVPDRLVHQLHRHFGNSFMLEIQYHDVDKQKAVNRHILSLYRQLGIPLIVGLDSHFIYPEQAELRDARLEANGLHYENEDGFYMDYPPDDEVFRRFMVQGVFSEAQIREAMENTDIFLNFEDIELDMSRKLPTLYPNLSQQERNERYRQLVRDSWREARKEIPQERWPEYLDAIKYEVDTITQTDMSDYFLLDYEVVKRYKELGGRITKTGRGSGPSYYTNTLLGFSSIDRLALPVTMYPDRFISKDRLLSGSTPDLDLNLGDPELAEQATDDIMGLWHCAPMVAWGTLQRSSAWKMYCRVEKIPPAEADAVSKQLKQYELAVKYAEDEEDAEQINPYDFVPEQYHEVLQKSEKYLGMIERATPHACAHLITNADIRREIGIYRINSKTGKKKVVLAAFIDGATADRFGYLKNDYLKVDIVNVNSDIYDRIGMPQPSVHELMKMTDGDKPTWDLYANGYTLGLNQVEKSATTDRVTHYKPKNMSELCAFVAAIRPAFKSMINVFLDRQHFDYGIPALDKLLQTREIPSSFILYQEQMMKVLQYAGFEASASYAAIKAIAKKHPEKVKPLREQFLEGFAKKLIADDGVSQVTAQETSENVWQIISDACSYGFNACLDGNEKMKGRKYSIATMYRIRADREYAKSLGVERLHDEFNSSGFGWAFSIGEDNRITLNSIVDIRDQGVRRVYRMTLDSGRSVVSTENHKFPVGAYDHLVRLDCLSVGDMIFVTDKPGFRTIPEQEEIISIELIGARHVYDVEMANPYHNFLLDSGIVTGNSHSAAVSLDSMYTAWAKAHYPYETYAALMTNYAKKGDKDRIDRARVEMKRAFGISIAPCRYRQDNRTFFIDKERHTISDTLMSVKCISYRVAQALYEMRDNQYESFTDLLIDMQTKPEFDTRVTEILIRMGYFEEFGHAGKLLYIYRMFNSGSLMYKKTHSAKTKATRREKLIALERESKETDIFFVDQLAFEAEYFGTPLSVYKERRWEAVVLDVDERYSIKVQLYNASKGTVGVMRIKKALYANCPLQKGDVIRVNDFRKTPARRYLNGKSVIDPDRYENWITSYQILPPQDPMTKKKE